MLEVDRVRDFYVANIEEIEKMLKKCLAVAAGMGLMFLSLGCSDASGVESESLSTTSGTRKSFPDFQGWCEASQRGELTNEEMRTVAGMASFASNEHGVRGCAQLARLWSSLTEADLTGRRIMDLRPLVQSAPNLVSLRLTRNAVRDASPAESLKKLEFFYIDEQAPGDFSSCPLRNPNLLRCVF